MRVLRTILIVVIVAITLSSCNFFRNIFGGNKSGCPSNGKNVGAERLLQDENAKGKKRVKAPKYKLDKFE
jgi:hypothetical protein